MHSLRDRLAHRAILPGLLIVWVFAVLMILGCLQAASHSNTNLAAYAPTRSLRFGPHAFLATIGGRFSVSTHLIQGANPSCQRRQQDFRF
jgi:hypothetical protein